jgi:hypothetical protein
MAKLSRTQINYLEDKLNRVVEQKVKDFKKELGEDKTKPEIIMEELNAGKIKFIPSEEILNFFNKDRGLGAYYYNPSIRLDELISEKDMKRISKIVDEKQDKIINYQDKLRDAKQNALDKIVLEGVDVETAMAELNKIK